MGGRTILVLLGLMTAATVTAAVKRRPLRVWKTDAERVAIRAAFELQSAQSDYAVKNGGHFDSPDCLATPASCLPGYTGPPFLRQDFDAMARRAGYRLAFFPGPPANHDNTIGQPKSPHGVQTYALVATPPAKTWFGPRSVCVDSAARVCIRSNTTLDASDGLCPVECDR